METTKSLINNDELKQQFTGMILLDRIISGAEKIHSSLMEKDDEMIEPTLDVLMQRDLLEIDSDHHYQATEKGQKLYQTLLNQRLSYATHFEIYAFVDLGEGRFADQENDFLDDECWDDLRVAVARFKGIDPYRMVFLAMLSDGTLLTESDWKFRLAMGSLFEELEEIVETQIREEDLAYEDEEGLVSGNVVLEDVIHQGAELNQERFQEQEKNEKEEQALANRRNRDDDDEVVTIIEDGGYDYGYSPFATFGAYAASALFIESIWHDPYW